MPSNVEADVCRDKKDLMVLGAAEAGNADIIITGDNDLLVIKSYKNIKILSPRDSMKYLKT
jgi:predicted nucleic acid-binding protein